MADNMTIAVLGTGLMGAPMARNLAKAGFALRVWNRTRAKAEALAGESVQVADTPTEAVQGADVIITMLSDGTATGALVMDPALTSALKPGATWIDMSSTRPDEAKAQQAHLATLGHAHLDAPVSGGTKGAEAATLAIMAGGDQNTFDAVKPVLEAMGRPVLVGGPGAGQLAKLANQAIVAVTIGAVAEAMLLLQKSGADPAAVRQALQGGFADSVILQQHGARMTDGNFQPGGLSRFQLKDLVNVLSAAGDAELALPLVQNLHDRFERMCADYGWGDLDHSAIFLDLRRANGLPMPDGLAD